MADSCDWFPIPREEIDAWVAKHHADLPRTLAALSAYPIPFRKAIVQALPREIVASLWREHLLSFTGSVDPEQNQVITDAVEAIATIFGGSDSAGTHLHALNDRIQQLVLAGVFSPQQIAEIFATLGPAEPPGGLPLPPGNWSATSP